MKPQQLPDEVKDDKSKPWEAWPRLEILQAESGLTITKLRVRLSDVPCFRCPDKSVRYEPAAARSALYDRSSDDDADDEEEIAGINAESMASQQGVLGLLALVFREQMRANAETRKERQDTIRVMQQPLETGLRLTENLVKTLVERLAHLEGLWGTMIELTETMQAMKAQRELDQQKQTDSAAMRKHALGLLDKHGPALWNKWQLTREAQLALSFLGSLDPAIINVVQATGVLTAEQNEMLTQLAAALAKRKPPEQAKADEHPEPPAPTPPATPPATPPSNANHAAAA